MRSSTQSRPSSARYADTIRSLWDRGCFQGGRSIRLSLAERAEDRTPLAAEALQVSGILAGLQSFDKTAHSFIHGSFENTGCLEPQPLGQVTLKELPGWLSSRTPRRPRDFLDMIQKGKSFKPVMQIVYVKKKVAVLSLFIVYGHIYHEQLSTHIYLPICVCEQYM